MIRWFRRKIVLASPHCTLWIERWDDFTFRFRFWPKWYVTHEEIEDTQ